MNYPPSVYAKVFLDTVLKASVQDQDGLIKRFIGVVLKNGDWVKINKILREINKLLVKNNEGRLIKVEFAREVDESLLQKVKQVFSTKDFIEVAFQPHLIAGIRILFDDEFELDYSLNKKLKKIFK